MADKYPDGKINQDDEGELELKTVVYEGRVIMSWGNRFHGSALLVWRARRRKGVD
jgi:hypothetical protein